MTTRKNGTKLLLLAGGLLVNPALSEDLSDMCAINTNGLVDIASCVTSFKKKDHVSQSKLVKDLKKQLKDTLDSKVTLTSNSEINLADKKIATLTFLKDILEPKVTCKKGFSHVTSAVSTHIYRTLSANSAELIDKEASSYIGGCLEKIPNLLPTKVINAKKTIDSSLAEVGTALNSLLTVDPTVTTDSSGDNSLHVTKYDSLNSLQQDLRVAKRALADNATLDIGWDSDFVTNFYVGFEGNSVSGLQEKGTSRIGFMVYGQPYGEVVIVKDENGEDRLNNHFSPHFFTNILSTSSAEQSTEASDNDGIPQVFALDMNMYWPLDGSKSDIGIQTDGIILSYGITKLDDEDQFTKKPYIGYRTAHSPELFYDILFGKTEGLPGKRIELRGQIPIDEVLSGRLFVGLNVNFGVKDEGDSKDSVKLYVTWQVSFSDIFSN